MHVRTNWQLITVVLIFALTFSIGGCGLARTGVRNSDQAINSLRNSDQAIETIDDVAKSAHVPKSSINEYTLRTPRSEQLSNTIESGLGKVTRDDVDLVKEGGCAILDYRLNVGTSPTFGQINSWVGQQAAEMAVNDRVVLRAKLFALRNALAEDQYGSLDTSDVAKAWVDVGCAVPIGESGSI